MRRRGFLGALSFSFCPFSFVRAEDESAISRTFRGLDSQDLATFRASCGIISELHNSFVRRLLEIAKSGEDGRDEAFRIRFAVETLGAIKCVEVIPVCIQRIDFVNTTRYASESDLYLGRYPFARCLANFGKVGVDAVLQYLGYGDSDRESEQRLALFAFVLQFGYTDVGVKKGTVLDYAKSYQAPRSRKNLDEVVKMLQLSSSDLAKLIEQ